jgi:hypothetical protein
VKSDSTLRPGDIVSTKDGLMAYGGGRGQTPAFTPVNTSAIAPAPRFSRVRLLRRGEAPSVDDATGTIVPPPGGQTRNVPRVADLSLQIDR